MKMNQEILLSIEIARIPLLERLKKIMVKNSMTYIDCALDIGTTRPTLNRFFKGRTISLNTLHTIESYVTNKERE